MEHMFCQLYVSEIESFHVITTCKSSNGFLNLKAVHISRHDFVFLGKKVFLTSYI